MINYSLTRELTTKTRNQAIMQSEPNFQMISKYLDGVVSGLDIEPGSLQATDQYNSKFSAHANESTIGVTRGSNEQSYITIQSEGKGIVVNLNSRLNWVTVNGFVKAPNGYYYISQDRRNKVIRPGKSYEQIEEEVKKDMPDSLYSDQLQEIYERQRREGEDINTTFCYCKVTFYDNDSISYCKRPDSCYVDQVAYSLSEFGIAPTSTMEFEVQNQDDMIGIINEFYREPEEFLSKVNMGVEREATL